jgi:hypothetical protein
MNVFMYEHARTLSRSVTLAPSDSSLATVLTGPLLLAQCIAELLL